MNPSQLGSEKSGDSGNLPLETTPVEAKPLQMPTEDLPQQVENSVPPSQTDLSEQVTVAPPTIIETPQAKVQLEPHDVKKVNQLAHEVSKGVDNLSAASQMVEATSFEG